MTKLKGRLNSSQSFSNYLPIPQHITPHFYTLSVLYIINVRAYLFIYSHTYFLSTLYSTSQAVLQKQEKSPGEALFYIRRIITFIADFYIRKVYITKKKSILYFFVFIAFFLCNKFISYKDLSRKFLNYHDVEP